MEVQVETPDAQDLMSDSVMLSGRENSVASSVPRNTRRNTRRHGKTSNILLDKAVRSCPGVRAHMYAPCEPVIL